MRDQVDTLPSTTKRVSDVDRQVGARVKAVRNHLRMSQSLLASKIGVTFQQVQKYEKGTNRVGASRLQRIADALGVSVSSFFDNTAVSTGFDLEEYVHIPDPNLRLQVVKLVEAFEQRKASLAAQR
ncbi:MULTISPECIES: helix-turn-helix domain-containing protein [unclassified Aureimonas]|uniref:helix-turn-helix domain-containing protein n=1 Tax=unclassified Aureimonas TaxID=2615206 RepID=UPI0009E8099A|nr:MULTISPECIES: helix-turn-helix transcriptional regulator [unclassified Aureimonas]